VATQQERETHTDGSGVYVFNALKPSMYTLHITSQSFGPADRTHIAVATQDSVTRDVQLSVFTASDTIQVNTVFVSSNFGKITAQANFPRYLQLGLHVTL
jgi:hypothetical protein